MYRTGLRVPKSITRKESWIGSYSVEIKIRSVFMNMGEKSAARIRIKQGSDVPCISTPNQ
jgi:hypothetical protein